MKESIASHMKALELRSPSPRSPRRAFPAPPGAGQPTDLASGSPWASGHASGSQPGTPSASLSPQTRSRATSKTIPLF